MARCNLAPELRKEYINRREYWQHNEEDIERCRGFFKNFLFIECSPWESPKDRAFKCSSCGAAWMWGKKDYPDYFKLHHGDSCRCPHCGESLTAQIISRVGNGGRLYQTEAVSFVEVTERGAVTIDSGIAFYDWNMEGNIENSGMDITFIAKRRYYIEPGTVQGWKRSLDYCWGTSEWDETVNICEPFSRNSLYGFDGFGYLIGAEKLRESQLKYSAVEKYYEDYHGIDIRDNEYMVRLFPQYLAEYAMNQNIEMIVKLGMSEAVGILLRDGKKNAKTLNWNAKTPADFVRLSKADAKVFYQDPSLDYLKTEWGGCVDIYFEGSRTRNGIKTRNAEIAFINEYGDRDQSARPFMGNAIAENEDKIVQAGIDILGDWMENEFEK